MSRQDLEKLSRDIEKALEKLEIQELKAAREAVEKAAAEYGFSLNEVLGGAGIGKRGGKSRGASQTKSAPKYKNPEDETQTWTGKGRQPQWFKDALTRGIDPKTLEI